MNDETSKQAAASGPMPAIRLVCGPDDTSYLVEGTTRRTITNTMLVRALELTFGRRFAVSAETLAAWVEGPPVVARAAPGVVPAFVVVGGRRLTLLGLPEVHGMPAEEALALVAGPTLDIGPALESSPRTELPPLPTFLILGAQKSATRWLRTNLGAHPEVCVASTELEYFWNSDTYRNFGPDGYRAQFVDWKGEAIVGEATPAYMMWRQDPGLVAERIRETVPDVRLIALLRNPVDRAHSAMVHHIKRGRLPQDADLLTLVRARDPKDDPLSLISGGWYAASLEPYRALFGDQLLVLLHDDVTRDPRGVYKQALAHIGASPGFVPDKLTRVLFSQRPRGDSGLSHETRRELYEFFRDDVRTLERMIGRDLSHWDPAVRPVDRVEVAAAAQALVLEAPARSGSEPTT